MANKERKEIFSGARARIIARGKRVGWATGCSGGREYQKEPIEVCGNPEVEEHATLGYRINLRATMVGIVTGTLVGDGLLPEIGQSDEEHLKNIILLEPFTVQIEDIVTGKVIYEFQDMEISAESFNVGARSVLMKDVTFVGKRLSDVAET